MIELTIREGMYFSQKDEDSFYGWLKSIGCVADVRGDRDGLHISIRGVAITNVDLTELIGLFHRYGIDKKPLAQFANENNASWFRNEAKYWYRDVFGAKPVERVRKPK